MRKKEGEGTRAPTTLVPAETTSDSVPEVVEAEAEAVVVEKPKAKRRKVKDTTKTRSVRNRTHCKGNSHVLKFRFRVPQQLGRAFYSYSLFFRYCKLSVVIPPLPWTHCILVLVALSSNQQFNSVFSLPSFTTLARDCLLITSSDGWILVLADELHAMPPQS